MSLRESFRRRRKDTRFIVGVLVVLFFVLTGLYYLLQRTRDLPSVLVTNRVLVFALFYISTVLILALLLILGRNVYFLFVDRRAGKLGSKFKFKLVATYIGLALVPVLLLYFYANELLLQSIDRWFAAPVHEVLEQGSAVAQGMLSMVEQETVRDARAVARDLSTFDLDQPRLRPLLSRELQAAISDRDLDYLGVYREGEFVHAVIDPGAGLEELPEPGRSFLEQVATTGSSTRRIPGSEEDATLIVGGALVPEAPFDTVIVVAGKLLGAGLATQSQALIQAFQNYRQLEVQKEELTLIQIFLLSVITLLIVLASSWVGLKLARRVTVPIGALVEGTRRISEGDLSYRVDAEADDELGVLVDSFNQMTRELEENERLLEESNRELTTANRQLSEERALLVAVLQNVAAGVVAIDASREVFLCNDAALDMLRQRSGEVRDRPIDEVWSDDERRKLLALFENGDEARLDGTEVRLTLGGDWKTFEVKVSEMHDAAGGHLGSVMVLEDLTELIKAQQHAAWRDAARRVAHEIKNPLTPIKLAAERLLRRRDASPEVLDETVEEAGAIIVREVEALRSMVDEFSRFARMPRPRPTEIDLEGLVEETTKLYEGLKEGVEVDSSIAPDARRAWGDPEQIKSALLNLLDNAVDAIEPPGRVEVRAATSDGTLRLSVSDTGPGIPAESRDKLFLPHFSTKGRGTGLGLAIVHRIVSDHHGTIAVDSNEPKGTVFTIQLPMA